MLPSGGLHFIHSLCPLKQISLFINYSHLNPHTPSPLQTQRVPGLPCSTVKTLPEHRRASTHQAPDGTRHRARFPTLEAISLLGSVNHRDFPRGAGPCFVRFLCSGAQAPPATTSPTHAWGLGFWPILQRAPCFPSKVKHHPINILVVSHVARMYLDRM